MTCSWLQWWMKANNASEEIGQHGILKTALWDKMLWFIEVVQSLRLLALVENIIKWNLKAFSFVNNFKNHKLILCWVIRPKSFVKISTFVVMREYFQVNLQVLNFSMLIKSIWCAGPEYFMDASSAICYATNSKWILGYIWLKVLPL